MGLINTMKKIFSNNNKKTISQFGNESIVFGANATSFAITEASLLRIPEFYSAMEMISNSVAQTIFEPTKIQERDGGSLITNKVERDSPWFNLLNKKPNEFMDKHTFWQQNIMNYFLRGGFYIWINKNDNGVPKELIPIDPDMIEKVKINDETFAYELTAYQDSQYESKKFILNYNDVIAVNYSSLERVSDLKFKYIFKSLLEQLGLKSDYDSQQLNQAPRLLAHVKGTGKLNDEDRQVIKSSLDTFFKNAKTQDKSAVLVTDDRYTVELINKNGSTIKSAVDKDFVKSLMVKLANALHIPLPKLNILDSGSSQYKSREGIQIDYLQDAISPIINKIISKLNEIIYKNSTTKEFKYSYNELLKFDKQTLGTYSEKMQGILTINELRHLNGMPPRDGFDIIISINGNPTDLSMITEKMKSEIDKNNKEGNKNDGK